MRRSISLVGIMLLSLPGFGLEQASAQGTKSSAPWTPSAAALKQLDPAVEVDQYTLRVPKGYERQQVDANVPPGMKVWGWASAARKDGTKASITMNLMAIPAARANQIKSMSLEQLADRMIGGLKRQRTNWKQERAETGAVNGIKFARIRWAGTEPNRLGDMRGVVYVSFDGDNLLQLASQDPVAYTAKTLPLAEASILTLKRK